MAHRWDGTGRCSLDAVVLGVGLAQDKPDSGRGRVGADGPTGWVECAIEEHRLEPDVVVEPFQVAQVGRGRADVGVQMRPAVAGDFQAVRCGVRGDDAGDADAAGMAARAVPAAATPMIAASVRLG